MFQQVRDNKNIITTILLTPELSIKVEGIEVKVMLFAIVVDLENEILI